MSSDDGDRITLVHNLATLAVALVEKDASEQEFRTTIGETVNRFGETADAGLLREAAAVVGVHPAPLDVSEELELSARPDVLGVAEQLGTQMRARELLESWARDL